MRYTNLGISDVPASVLGFGCAGIMGRAGRRQSLRALHAAYECGVTFFDTARSYGYGESESVVGEFLRGRRNRVILSTKFGIIPTRQPRWKRALMPALRALFDVVPSARSLVRGQVHAQFQENQLTVGILRRSMEESLRRLRTDYVDILFIHSAPQSALSQFDLLEELEKLVAAGKVRMAGISAEPEVIAAALKANIPMLQAMQFPMNFFDLRILRIIVAAQNRGLVLVGNHPFGGIDRVAESKARLRQLSTLPSIPPGLRRKLDLSDDAVLSEVILNLILTGTGIQVALPSMMNARHLKANVKAISNCRFTADELNWIRRHVGGNAKVMEMHAAENRGARAS